MREPTFKSQTLDTEASPAKGDESKAKNNEN